LGSIQFSVVIGMNKSEAVKPQHLTLRIDY